MKISFSSFIAVGVLAASNIANAQSNGPQDQLMREIIAIEKSLTEGATTGSPSIDELWQSLIAGRICTKTASGARSCTSDPEKKGSSRILEVSGLIRHRTIGEQGIQSQEIILMIPAEISKIPDELWQGAFPRWKKSTGIMDEHVGTWPCHQNLTFNPANANGRTLALTFVTNENNTCSANVTRIRFVSSSRTGE